MAIAEQDRIKRYTENFRKNTFSHNDSNKYYFKCWNTKRNGKGTSYTDELAVALPGDTELYAIWQERNLLQRYENFKITADNVTYDKEYTNVHWSVNVVSYYEGTNYVVSTTLDTGDDISDNFGKNGVQYSENATLARSVKIRYVSKKYKNKDSYGKDIDVVAETTITQYGYTPIYCVDALINLDKFDINCVNASNSKPANKTKLEEGKYRFSCSNKMMKFTITPTSSYNFLNWKGIGIEGNTSTTISLLGSTIGYNIINANTILKPIALNLVVGTWRKSWTKTTYTTHTAIAYHWVWHWLGWWWGWWYYGPYTYTYQVAHTSTVYNDYYNANNVAAPYIMTMPASGTLTVKGKYGIKVYGCSCTRVGGFYVFINDEKFKKYEETLNNTDKEFSFSVSVKKGDKVEITKTYSTTDAHIAVYVESAILDENNVQLFVKINNMYDSVRNAESLNNFKQRINDAITNKTAKDHSVCVAKAGEVKRDQDNLPLKTLDYTTSEQQILKISINGCHGYGYTRQLRITDKTNNNIVFDSTYNQKIGGELINRECYIYMPENSTIQIDACWHRVDTQHYDAWLNIYSIDLLN